METEKINAEVIINWLIEKVESKVNIDSKLWLEIAFKLNVLYLPEVQALEQLRQLVAMRKLEILNNQTKRNVAAADLEVEASDNYKEMKIQEAKVEQIKEFIRIAKRNTDNL